MFDNLSAVALASCVRARWQGFAVIRHYQLPMSGFVRFMRARARICEILTRWRGMRDYLKLIIFRYLIGGQVQAEPLS